jgi:glycosyltransferase involved in cell wall biosynthesis
MKIILVAPYFYPHKGGLEQYCWEIATRLSNLGHEITVITSQSKNEKESENSKGFKIVRLKSWNLLNGRWPLPKFSRENYKILKEIYKQKPDITINNTRFFPICLMVGRFSKKLRVKVIHIEHGTCYPKMESKFKSFLAKFYDDTFGRWTISLADEVIGISQAAAEFAKKLGVKNPKVIYNSVDTDFFNYFCGAFN